MAVMIPGLQYKDLQKDFNGSVGEFRLYELLKKLPEEYRTKKQREALIEKLLKDFIENG